MKKKISTWLCIMLTFCGQAAAQQITAENRPLTEVLQQVQQQTKYRFYWIASETAGINVSVNTDAKDIHQLMKALLKGTDNNKIDKTKLRCLYQRGILENVVNEDERRNKETLDDEYIFCCRYLFIIMSITSTNNW